MHVIQNNLRTPQLAGKGCKNAQFFKEHGHRNVCTRKVSHKGRKIMRFIVAILMQWLVNKFTVYLATIIMIFIMCL